ncbi:MAG: hypothetical protein AB8B96_06390 [Lysobacterales bacterium]
MTDAPHHYYLEDRLRTRSPDVLLTRVFMPQSAQPVINAQFVLLDELVQLAMIRESGVAMTKLAWWFEEWKRLIEGEPRHPVTQTLLASRTRSADEGASNLPLLWPKLDGALSVVGAQIQGEAPTSQAELITWLTDLAEPLADLELCGGKAPPQLTNVWAGIVLLHWLSSLERLADVGRAPWPLDLSAQTQIRREQLGDNPAREQAAEALWSLMDEPITDGRVEGCGHAGVYLAVASRTVLARASGKPAAGRWRSLLNAWRARRQC